ncbi:LysR family transcriptional regulator [Alginatibacterium sediminis]|nr:LysR family transcriptional regulator [Alginatibacterium sediminis]
MLGINSHYLECFVAAAQSGTFNKAAKRLGKSASTVSRWINEFEQHLDYQLFERQSNGLVVVLSEKGALLLPKAIIAIDYLKKFEHLALSIHDKAAPLSLTMSFSELVSINGVAQVISDLKVNSPNLQIALRNVDLSNVQNALDEQHVDFALGIISDSLYPNVGGVLVGNENVRLIAHPSNPLANQSKVSTDMLLGQCAIWSSPYAKTQPYQSALFNSIEVLECSDLSTVVALVKQNLGVALLPEYIAHSSITAGEVVALDLHKEEVDQSIQLMLYYRLDYPYPEIVAQLTDSLRDWFGYIESI